VKVFVVAPGPTHDGYGRPFGVYTTRARANAVAQEYESTPDGGVFGCDIVELELDAPPAPDPRA